MAAGQGSDGAVVIEFPGSYLVLELANGCPLRCRHCLQSRPTHDHFQQQGLMDPALIRRLVEELAQSGARFDNLVLFWLGEPLLHPGFPEILSWLQDRAWRDGVFRQIEIHTNAVLLEEPHVEVMFRRPELPQRWHFSLDAATRQTYRAIKGRDRFEQVTAAVEQVVRRKGTAGDSSPRLVFQFIVQEANQAEAEAFRDHWQSLGQAQGLDVGVCGGHVPGDGRDHVFFRQLDDLEPARQGEADSRYRAVLRRLGMDGSAQSGGTPQAVDRPPTCSGFFKSPVVNHDGRVTVCTRDSELQLFVGDLTRQSFRGIWWDQATLHRRRLQVITGDYGELPLCQGCPIPRSANYTGIEEWEIREYLERSR
jgi:organic radical activating enzyme